MQWDRMWCSIERSSDASWEQSLQREQGSSLWTKASSTLDTSGTRAGSRRISFAQWCSTMEALEWLPFVPSLMRVLFTQSFEKGLIAQEKSSCSSLTWRRSSWRDGGLTGRRCEGSSSSSLIMQLSTSQMRSKASSLVEGSKQWPFLSTRLSSIP